LEGLFFLLSLRNYQCILTGRRGFCCIFQGTLTATVPGVLRYIWDVTVFRPEY